MSGNEGFLDRLRELIKRGEGSIPHMYLDTVGKVTVAVGNMLPDAQVAAELPFVHRDTGANATADEIEQDFHNVAGQQPGKLAQSYRQYTRLELTEDAINTLLDQRIAGFEAGLRKDFPGYDNYPDAAKLGLLDMAFNLGNNGLIKKFPSFTRAAQHEDWAECAAECNRNGISSARNEEIKNLFASIA